MNDAADSADVDRAMEHLPAAPAETPNPAGSGSNGKRNEKHKSSKADGDERPLGDVFPHGGQVKGLIRPNVREEVKASVEKSEETKHAAEANHLRKLEQLAQRRNAKREDQKAQRPITGGVLNEFDGIGAEPAAEETPEQGTERDEAEQKEGNFGPPADEESAHAEVPA